MLLNRVLFLMLLMSFFSTAVFADDLSKLFSAVSNGKIDIVKQIIKHLGIWDTHNHDPPQKPAGKTGQIVYDDTYSQVPSFDYWS